MAFGRFIEASIATLIATTPIAGSDLQRTTCLPPTPPTNLRVYSEPSVVSITVTNPDGNSVVVVNGEKKPPMFYWDYVPGVEYDFRLDDPTTVAIGKTPDVIVNSLKSANIEVPLENPTTYSWWVHAKNQCSVSAATGSNFGIVRTENIVNNGVPATVAISTSPTR